jgi:trehalose/maltose hydrolase-like predicted phosphorylase
MMNLPEELDLSQHPYLTMEVFPVDQSTIHWIWFWDVTGARNTLNTREGDHIQQPMAGKWNKLVFDFSRPNDWVNNDTGQPINNKRIKQTLFDMHNAEFNWPLPPTTRASSWSATSGWVRRLTLRPPTRQPSMR